MTCGAAALIVLPSVAMGLSVDPQRANAAVARSCSPPSVVRRVNRTANPDITSVGITYFAGRSRGGDDAHLAAALTRELAVQLLSARIRSDTSKRDATRGRLLTVKLSEGGGFADVALSMTGAV